MERVRITKAVENYPTILIEAGALGTLVRIDEDGSYWVRLDEHHAELDEWHNELQLWDWSADNGQEEHPESFIKRIG